MIDNSVLNFVICVNNYCELIETTAGQKIEGNLYEFAYVLSNLYTSALKLKYVEPSDKDICVSDIKIKWGGFEGFDFYWEVHPFEEMDKGCGSLIDDILDIYKDVKRGLLLFNSDIPDDKTNAIWYWKFHFDIHWGEHAINALRVLHIARERY